MKKIVLLLCAFLGGAAALRAQAIRPLPDDIYQDIPFEMQAVALPTFPDYRVSIVDFGATAGAGTLNTQAIDAAIRHVNGKGGGTVENIYCRRINMFDIANENILFDLYYATKEADAPRPAAVDEGTPVFRNIHISDITGIGGKKAVYFNGLPEMPIQDIKLRNISLADTDKGVIIRQAENVVLENVAVAPRDQRPYVLQNVKNVRLNGRTIPAVEKSKTFER